MVTSDAAQISWKIHFYPNLGKKMTKKIEYLAFF